MRIPYCEVDGTGRGVDSFTSERKSSALELNGAQMTDVDSTGEKSVHKIVVDSEKKHEELTEIGFEFSGKGWGVEASAAAKFLNSRKYSQKNIHLTAVSHTISKTTKLEMDIISKLKFNPHASELIQSGKFDQFKRHYGDAFIIGYQYGGFCIADLKIKTSSSEDKSSVTSKIGAGFSAYGFGAKMSVEYSNNVLDTLTKHESETKIYGSGIASTAVDSSNLDAIATTVDKAANDGSRRLHSLLFKYEDLFEFQMLKSEESAGAVLLTRVDEAIIKRLCKHYNKILYTLNTIDELMTMETSQAMKERLQKHEVTLSDAMEIIRSKTAENLAGESERSIDKWQELCSLANIHTEVEQLAATFGKTIRKGVNYMVNCTKDGKLVGKNYGTGSSAVERHISLNCPECSRRLELDSIVLKQCVYTLDGEQRQYGNVKTPETTVHGTKELDPNLSDYVCLTINVVRLL